MCIRSDEYTQDEVSSLCHKDPGIRAAAIRMLGETGDEQAVGKLVTILQDCAELAWLRACAAYALGRLGYQEASGPLVTAVGHDNTLISRAAILALGDIGCSNLSSLLTDIIRDKSKTEIHPVAVIVLGKIADESCHAVILEATQDRDVATRIQAIQSVGDLRMQAGVQPLIDLTRDLDERVRAAAVSALGRICDKRALPALTVALEDESVVVRAIAASSVGCLGDPSAVHSLNSLLNDGDIKVRMQVTAALRKLGATGS